MARPNVELHRRKLYRIYVDESGDHTYHSLDDAAKRYLGLSGCIIESEYYATTFQPALEVLKRRYFHHDPDEPIILHRREIIEAKGTFWRLRNADNRQAFDQDLLKFFCEQKYVLITVVIDKKAHLERYGESAFHPYHYCLAALLERYCGFLKLFDATCDVMLENRQKTEDEKLIAAYRMLYDSGTQQRSRDFFQKVLTSCEPKLKPKTANIACLQMADLLAYPSKQEVLMEAGRISGRTHLNW